MSYFVWIDPFAEIERANHMAAHAREQGRNEVLDYEYCNPGLIQSAIEMQAYEVAERVVEERIKPTFYDAMNRKRIHEATLELLSFTPMKHIVPRIEARTLSQPVYDVDERNFGIMTEIEVKPFRYTVMDRLS